MKWEENLLQVTRESMICGLTVILPKNTLPATCMLALGSAPTIRVFIKH
jgi:hypothetical protein